MEIKWLVIFPLVSLMVLDEALLEKTNNRTVHGELKEEKTRIKKRELIDDNNEVEHINTLLHNDSKTQYSPRSMNSRIQKKRLLRKKLLKKVLKSGHSIYVNRFAQNSKKYPVKTLHQHICQQRNE